MQPGAWIFIPTLNPQVSAFVFYKALNCGNPGLGFFIGALKSLLPDLYHNQKVPPKARYEANDYSPLPYDSDA